MSPQSHDTGKQPGRRLPKGFLVTLCCMILVLLVFIALIRPVVRYQIARKHSAKFLKTVRDHLEKPIAVPKEWLNEKPYAEETLRDLLEFNRETDALISASPLLHEADLRGSLLNEINKGGMNEERIWTSISLLNRVFQPCLMAAERLFNQPDYEFQIALFPKDLDNGEPRRDRQKRFMGTVCMVSHSLLRTGERNQLSRTMDAATSFTMHHPAISQSSASTLMILQGYLFRTYGALAVQTSDTQLLHSWLDKLRSNRHRLFHPVREWDADTMVSVSFLRQTGRNGFPVSWLPEAPPVHYSRQYYLGKWKYADWFLANRSSSDLRYASHQEWARRNARSPSASGLLKRSEDWIAFTFVPEYYCEIVGYSGAEFATLEMIQAQTYYDLTLAFLAMRLSGLESSDGTKNPEQSLRKYLGQVPQDRFGSGSLRYSTKQQQFYSIGNDRTDDGGDPKRDVFLLPQLP